VSLRFLNFNYFHLPVSHSGTLSYKDFGPMHARRILLLRLAYSFIAKYPKISSFTIVLNIYLKGSSRIALRNVLDKNNATS
jgi:hypothetical protein